MDNLGYIEELYRAWEGNPSAVGDDWAAYFGQSAGSNGAQPGAAAGAAKGDMAYRQGRVDSLLWAYRDIGYLYARLNPLGGDHGPDHDYLRRGDIDAYEKLTPSDFGISPDDMDTVFSAGRG